ncbi:uncharacterized protein LOC128997401 [Macrosteles quadrilineatus]|uniref:uncharacterized protein LOC128997401 n=1 Tax=Macrosteles quadrilineatus TaxID=74068 RepID=UPI0023E19E87|nr:uncharacterized protein LOC128997401 [Macrosteles quadrilineatus]
MRGEGTDSKYETPWFAYSSLTFILDSDTSRDTKDYLHGISDNIEDTLDEDEETNEMSIPECSWCGDVCLKPGIERKDMSENINTSEHTHTNRNLLKRKKEEEKKEEEAFTSTSIAQKDDCNIFVQMVEAELRKLNPKNRVIAKNKIQNILFDLQLQEINETQSDVINPK